MFINVNQKWHRVVWTDPDYISVRGEQLHRTRCGLLKIRISYGIIHRDDTLCGRCEKLAIRDMA